MTDHRQDGGGAEDYVGSRYAQTPPPSYPPYLDSEGVEYDPYQQRASTTAQRGTPWVPQTRQPQQRAKTSSGAGAGIGIGVVLIVVAIGAFLSNTSGDSASDIPSFEVPEYTPPNLPTFSAPEIDPIPGSSEGEEEPPDWDAAADGTWPSPLPDEAFELSVGQPVPVLSSSGELVGELDLLEVRRGFSCDNDRGSAPAGTEVIGLRLSTATTDAIGFIDVQSHTARAMNADGEPVYFRGAYGCSDDPIEQISRDGSSEEGWFTITVDSTAETFAWDHGTGDSWVVVDVSESTSR